METRRIIYDTYLQPQISTVEQHIVFYHIVFYQCRSFIGLGGSESDHGQMTRWLNLDILLSYYRRHHYFSRSHLPRLHPPLQQLVP